VLLYNTREDSTTVSYSRYLYSVYLGYEVPNHLQVDHINDDKTDDRLDEKVMRLETAILQKEPENKYDPNAIAAYTQDGLKIGYIPKDEIESVKSIMGNNPKLDVEMSYMDFNAGSINIRIKTWVTKSLLSEKLFKLYSPIEVYRANYVYRKWGVCNFL
jgi:hypothetical protein